ncbi:hypothetical protein ACL90Y_06925 [Micrococcus luteus]
MLTVPDVRRRGLGASAAAVETLAVEALDAVGEIIGSATAEHD